ncbi:hypothetical protein ACIQU5_16160 [Streptomyces sp. NPDC090306]|uniref:hypothetical protein n=1 Tax=Streptomyces sp. NPDC090306 TaxID=3365961 RepID=UPI00382BCF70
MAWNEWEQLKARAAQRSSGGMQIDHLAPDGGGGGDDLVVRQDDLGAVGHEAKLLYEGLRKQADIEGAGAGDSGSGSTAQAAAALKSHSFATGAALETTVRVWTSQADSVLQACAHISNHLDYSQKRHAEDDAQIGTVMNDVDGLPVSVSKLNEYFK